MFRAFSTTVRVATNIVMLALVMSNPAAAKTVFPINGGSGDAGFHDLCPANQYLTGLAGRTGNWVDQIQIICSPILPNGTHGTSYYGPQRGGPNGAAQEFSCSSDSFVTGVVLYWNDPNNRVTEVALTCTSTQTNRSATVNFGGQEPSATLNLHIPEPCPNDELATGFAGRYGRDVNALGLLCDARAVASTNTAAPIRIIGKAPSTSASGGNARCPQGLVWREASPTDHVCVSVAERRITLEENRAAAEHVSATDQTYGPNTCAQGYVWREAYDGDVVCVTPEQRKMAADENQNAPPPAAAP